MMQRRDFLGSAASALALASQIRPAAAADKPKIGFLLKTMQEERYATDKALFIARAQELGAEVLFDSGNNDALTQLHQVEAQLDAGIQALVLQPVDTGTAGGLVSKAHARGVPVIGYDSMPQDTPLDLMVMQDSWAVGRLQGEAMLAWLKEKHGRIEGRVALIKGQPGDANAEALSQGFRELFLDQPHRLELVEERSHVNWSPDEARTTTESLLLKYDNRIDAFICNNDGLAAGVILALKAEGLADAGKVFVAGADADRRNIRWVAEGIQAVDVWKEIKPLADQAAEAALALIGHRDQAAATLFPTARLIANGTSQVPTIVTPVVLVTRDTIDSTVIAGGHLSHDQVYGPAPGG
ncbi:MAG: substrate-binding domain-containing protein [Geminicoccaceae bacterium]